MGDFNVDLLHYETCNQSRDLLDKMFSVLCIIKTNITTPTRMAPRSKTLIDNAFTHFQS